MIKYVTPLFIALVLLGAMIQPAIPWGEAFGALFSEGRWPFAPGSVIGKIFHVGDTGGWFDARGAVTPVFVKDLTRIVLLTVFALIAVLVRRAFQGRDLSHEDR